MTAWSCSSACTAILLLCEFLMVAFVDLKKNELTIYWKSNHFVTAVFLFVNSIKPIYSLFSFCCLGSFMNFT